MKRYTHAPDGPDCCSYMKPDAAGDYIRHDDPDLAALVEAVKDAHDMISRLYHVVTAEHYELVKEAVRLVNTQRQALAAVAPGTTRGSDE